jgi:hypothetical protein
MSTKNPNAPPMIAERSCRFDTPASGMGVAAAQLPVGWSLDIVIRGLVFFDDHFVNNLVHNLRDIVNLSSAPQTLSKWSKSR